MIAGPRRSIGGGPARACAPRVSVRRTQGTTLPGLQTFDFQVPIATTGDVRPLHRAGRGGAAVAAHHRAALERLQPGPIICDEHHVALPPKEQVYTEMEALIWLQVDRGGRSHPRRRGLRLHRGPTAKLGYSSSPTVAAKPYRIKVRRRASPSSRRTRTCWWATWSLTPVAILGSFNVIAGS